MADKRFPSDLTYKTIPVNADTVLISDSEGLGSEPVHGPKITTIENLVNMVGANLDISGKADKTNVLELTQIDAYTPTSDYHPATKLYSDNADAVVVAYVDSELAGHVVDFHALSATHAGDTVALSAAIDINTANIVTLSADVDTNTLGVADNATDVVALSAATDLKSDITYTDTQDSILSAAIDTNSTDVIALSASIDLLEIGSKVYTVTASGAFQPDIVNYNHFDVTVNGNMALGDLGGVEQVGQTGMLILQQDGTGSHTISFATPWQFPAGAPVENTTANAFNVFRYTVLSADNILCEFIADYVEV